MADRDGRDQPGRTVDRFWLGDGWPAVPGADALYFLGIGGPEHSEDVGVVEAFRWRFATVAGSDGQHDLLAFRSMPLLIAFTRAINDADPRTVPTEALRLMPADVTAGVDLWCRIDPDPRSVAVAAATGRLGSRQVPELSEGGQR